jgi:hypothetical protein
MATQLIRHFNDLDIITTREVKHPNSEMVPRLALIQKGKHDDPHIHPHMRLFAAGPAEGEVGNFDSRTPALSRDARNRNAFIRTMLNDTITPKANTYQHANESEGNSVGDSCV